MRSCVGRCCVVDAVCTVRVFVGMRHCSDLVTVWSFEDFCPNALHAVGSVGVVFGLMSAGWADSNWRQSGCVCVCDLRMCAREGQCRAVSSPSLRSGGCSCVACAVSIALYVKHCWLSQLNPQACFDLRTVVCNLTHCYT